MSIEKLKKQSKNLLNLLPAFMQTHAQGINLSSCQELVAQISGYPSWHAAQQRLTADGGRTTGTSDADPAVSQRDGKTFGRLPDAQGEISMDGADAETATAMRGYVSKVHEIHRRQAQSHDEGIPALKRLFEIAQGDSGQCRHVAAFLLGLYNGSRFPFDLTDLRCVDTAIFDDCMLVLKMDSSPKREVHTYFPNGGRAFEDMACRRRIGDVKRLRDVCAQIVDRGVDSFKYEKVDLTLQLEHAFANTWPED